MALALSWTALLMVSYLLGTFPSGFLAGRLLKGIDVRHFGSGSMGATNVTRVLGVKVGLLVFAADIAKGAGAAGLGHLLVGSPWAAAAGGLAAVAGHAFPFYLRFLGGRGVATCLGSLLVLSAPVGLIAVAFGITTIALFRYVSLGSLVGTLAGVAAAVLLQHWGWVSGAAPFYLAVGGAIIFFQHRENIRRLLSGKEHKFGQPTRLEKEGR